MNNERKRPSVAITLSRGALALVDKQAKEAGAVVDRAVVARTIREKRAATMLPTESR